MCAHLFDVLADVLLRGVARVPQVQHLRYNNQIRNRFYKSVHFNCLTSNINLFICNCLTSNINLLNFNCLMSNFYFPKNIFFTSRRERLFMDARPQFRVFNSPGEMMTNYLRDTNKFLRYRSPCTNILKCRFPTKDIELTWLKFFEGPRILSFEALGLDHFCRFGTKICRIQVKL